jgi:hypothetical protein
MPQSLAAWHRSNWPLFGARGQSFCLETDGGRLVDCCSHCLVVTANLVGVIAMAARSRLGRLEQPLEGELAVGDDVVRFVMRLRSLAWTSPIGGRAPLCLLMSSVDGRQGCGASHS